MRGPWDVIVADYSLPQFSAPEALGPCRRRGRDLPFLIVSGTIGEAAAVDAMRTGAHDYIMKDSLARLVPAIERELREAEGRRERRRAEEAQREEAAVSAALARVGRELISFLGTPLLLERLCEVTAIGAAVRQQPHADGGSDRGTSSFPSPDTAPRRRKRRSRA